MSKYIETDKHVFVVGMTGSGKSYLCEIYLRNYDYVVKLDTKNEYLERRSKNEEIWRGLEENKDYTVVTDFDELDNVETDKIIFAPPYEEQTRELFDKFFFWIFTRGNTILWIDELMFTARATGYPRELDRIFQQGRSKNVAVWACTQKPSNIPTIIPANCSYYFIFKCGRSEYKRLYELTGDKDIGNKISKLPKYDFIFYDVANDYLQTAYLKE